uniref:hypothetical protein n=1 Tax=Christensenella hongkongensis TaxID=270498 RepID=UPI002672545A
TGMMRKKRVILPHVFYIGGTNIMFGNMNVLEYLMLITQKQEEHPVRRQRRIFDQLNELGLAYLSLTPIQTLTPAERSIVLLLAGSYTQSVILVWNLPRLDYTTELAGAAEKICEVLKEQGKTLLFSTKDYGLADRISTHILLLKRGTAAYAGKAEEFRTKWDRLILTIRGCDTKHFEEIFRQAAPEYEYRIGDGAVEVLDRSSCETDFTTFYRITADNRLMPDLIERNRPNIGNAVEAAIRSDDI